MKTFQFILVAFSLLTSTVVLGGSDACNACTEVIDLLHLLWGQKTVDDCLGDAITFVCETLKIEDNFVCQGIVGEFKDEFFYVAGRLIVEPAEICGLLIKECGSPILELNSNWTIPIPGNKPSVATPVLPDPSKPKLRVLHITDIHIDPSYTEGTEADCTEPECCRVPKDTNDFAQRNIKVPAPKWGYIGNCDTPYPTLENMLQHIAATEKNLDYIVVSGDLESHADENYSHEGHIETVKNISNLFKFYFPNTKSYFAVGNHEGVPIDNFGYHDLPERFHMDWLYNQMADSWKNWVPSSSISSLKYIGSYVTQLFPGLRLISLNNALGDSMNFFLYINQTDPDGSMTWFAKQLDLAEKAGDKVHVVAHIGGGDSEALNGWAINYYNLVNRYESTIAAQFFGHTHSEQYYLTYEDMKDSTSRPTSVIFAAPSVTTYSEYNPAYRVYTIDGNYAGSSYGILDFSETFLNLTTQGNVEVPQWSVLFDSVKKEYNLPSLFASDWKNLLDHFIQTGKDDPIFRNYIKNYYRRDGHECDWNCWRGQLCSIKQAYHNAALCDDLPSQFVTDFNVEIGRKKFKHVYTKKTNFSHLPSDKIELRKYLLQKLPKDQCKL